MDEELNDEEVEERLYAMLYHADNTQQSSEQENNTVVNDLIAKTQGSTLRRYWRTSTGENTGNNTPNPYMKVNNPARNTSAPHTNKNIAQSTNKVTSEPNKNTSPTNDCDNEANIAIPKEEKEGTPPQDTTDAVVSFFNKPITPDTKISITVENDDPSPIHELESSDEDEVVEVKLPPKPTITIESSDEDEVILVPTPDAKKPSEDKNKKQKNVKKDQRVEVVTSPVPSVVSSISDDFIRGDCVALNISSRKAVNNSFDFSLHGAEFRDQSTPMKSKKKKKKNKEADTSINIVTPEKSANEGCFATPKSKSKKKKNKNASNNSYKVLEKSLPNADVYDDSDSNNSVDVNKKSNYSISEKSVPNMDIYESDSSISEMAKELDSSPIKDKDIQETISTLEKNQSNVTNDSEDCYIDLTGNRPEDTIEESIFVANLTGFDDIHDSTDDENIDLDKLGSTKMPAILTEQRDFDCMIGSGRKRRYSAKSVRDEMEKFYNESWGGENFNHREIQKAMSRDKNLWAIDPKDKMPITSRRKVTCNYCNRVGHKDDACRMKPAVCHFCGEQGHYDGKCPNKICLNCGNPNFAFSTICGSCSQWSRMTCNECGQNGHPASHCPDLWRRYHNTIDNAAALEKYVQSRKNSNQYCSGCARRGHLVHSCRTVTPFSGFSINTPFVVQYRPVYESYPQKRRFSEPSEYETPTKRRSVDSSFRTSFTEEPPRNKTPVKEDNRDKNGQMIQDNAVSDTSDAVTTAKIFVTSAAMDALRTQSGQEWLQEQQSQNNVSVSSSGCNLYLTVKGLLADQDNFQRALKEWIDSHFGTAPIPPVAQPKASDTQQNMDNVTLSCLPKKKRLLIDHLTRALNSLNTDLGDPKIMLKELDYQQKNRKKLMKMKVVSPKQLSNNRSSIEEISKRLNTLLLGKAGLGGGKKHVKALRELLQRATFVPKLMPVPFHLRMQIAQHYQPVFSPAIRDDYDVLVRQYYGHTDTPQPARPSPPPFTAKKAITDKMRARTLKEVRNKYRRLMMLTLNPNKNYHMKMQARLATKLHQNVTLLGNELSRVSLEQLKKINSVSEQAQQFITLNKNNKRTW